MIIAVEDVLSRAVVERILRHCAGDRYSPPLAQGLAGIGWLENHIARLNEAARRVPVLVLADLDRKECAPRIRDAWLPHGPAAKMIFRIAVREVEAWLLADREGLARFLKVSEALLPRSAEAEFDPKLALINIARRSKSRQIREGVPPRAGSRAPIGPAYNLLLPEFVDRSWNLENAIASADSLRRAVAAVQSAAHELFGAG